MKSKKLSRRSNRTSIHVEGNKRPRYELLELRLQPLRQPRRLLRPFKGAATDEEPCGRIKMSLQ
jgi:hypothetical protein